MLIPASSSQRGMSLIELMVGLAVGLVLSLGLFTLIASSSQNFRVNDDFARMQDGATAALRYIGDSVRMAGFYGYNDEVATINVAGDTITPVVPNNDCGTPISGKPWSLYLDNYIRGVPNLTPITAASTFPCLHIANFQTGLEANSNPVLITRGAGGYLIPDLASDGDLSAGLAEQPDYATNVYMQTDPVGGLIFYGADFAALKAASATRKFANGHDVSIFEYNVAVYYIRPCSRPTDGVVCDAASDNGSPIPTLVRQELVNGTMTEVPLVEGIERVRYQYGVDTSGDGVPDFFSETPADADWVNVVAVKVTVLARSPNISAKYDDSSKTYDLNGDGVVDYQCTQYPAPACNYKRKVFSETFQVRNIGQRRADGGS